MLVSVTQLNNYIKGVVDMDSTLYNIEVSGELTNAKMSHGYWYFTIKDQSSQIDCFAFGNKISTLTNGLQVIASGSISYLTKSGRVSFTVNSIKEIKEGQSYQQYVKLRKKLDALGLFDIARKKQLPYLPATIGVVTSSSGAVIQDITDVVKRRQPFTDILLYPVKVQGEDAVVQLVEGIQYMSTADVDIVIVARGGGSNEDLSVFNSEDVVMALSQCSHPTISAIGHGVDYTLCDMIADVRAVTPTEAGELATVDSARLCDSIKIALQNMANDISTDVQYARQHIVGTVSNILTMFNSSIDLSTQNVKNLLNAMSSNISNTYDNIANRIDVDMAIIGANNPDSINARGYFAVRCNGQLVTDLSKLENGNQIEILHKGGKITATITETK